MTAVEWFAFVVIPVCLILGGFLAERAHAFSLAQHKTSFIKTVLEGRLTLAIAPSLAIVLVAFVASAAFK